MQNPNDFIEVNINNLPEIDDIVPGDQLIVEIPTGTTVINFENVIFQPYQTSFYDEIETNSSTIDALSSEVAAVSSTINNLARTTNLSDLSAYVSSQILAASSSFITQIESGSSSFVESYVNDLYIPRTLYGIKASGIFSLNGGWVARNGSLGAVTYISDTLAIYNVSFQGLTTSNYLIHANIIPPPTPNSTTPVPYIANVYDKTINGFTVAIATLNDGVISKNINFGLVNIVVYF